MAKGFVPFCYLCFFFFKSMTTVHNQVFIFIQQCFNLMIVDKEESEILLIALIEVTIRNYLYFLILPGIFMYILYMYFLILSATKTYVCYHDIKLNHYTHHFLCLHFIGFRSFIAFITGDCEGLLLPTHINKNVRNSLWPEGQWISLSIIH